jgi:hypothetical protein
MSHVDRNKPSAKAAAPPPSRSNIRFLVLVALFVSPLARAGTQYDFTVRSEGAYTSSQSGRILTDGERWRIDLSAGDGVRAHDSVLMARDGRIVALHHTDQTWYELAPAPPVHVTSLFDFHRRYPTQAFEVKVTRIPAESSVAFRYKTRFAIGGETVTGSIWGRVVLHAGPADEKPSPMKLLFRLMTGSDITDQALHDAIAGSLHTAWRIELTLNRQFEGATAMTQIIEWSIENVRAAEVLPSAFDVPAQYANQAPQVGGPR